MGFRRNPARISDLKMVSDVQVRNLPWLIVTSFMSPVVAVFDDDRVNTIPICELYLQTASSDVSGPGSAWSS